MVKQEIYVYRRVNKIILKETKWEELYWLFMAQDGLYFGRF